MRGNHRIWGRQYPEVPDATTQEQRALIAQCTVAPTPGLKTWNDVVFDGRYIGKVRTGYGYQQYWPCDSAEGYYVFGDTSMSDPKHCLALIQLLDFDGRENATNKE